MYVRTLLVSLMLASTAISQAPLPQPQQNAPPRAGQPLPGLNPQELAYFLEGATRFNEIDSVSGTQPGATGSGLGPRFNLNSCAGCHAHPSVGGSSPQINPEIAMATNFGAINTLPAFVQQNGPVHVVRFLRNADGTPDGGVHNLFVITGRSDAAGCKIAQPDFATAAEQNNIALRIPTPVFGAGLIESITDSAILASQTANATLTASLGISGHVNRNPNDGTITRFGWKAQNKSLMLFGGEAYNVEQGVTNEIFPTERDETPGCVFNTTPEDATDFTASSLLKGISDVTGFRAFMRFLAPPVPAPDNPSIVAGRQAFAQIGCTACHTAILTTGNADSPALRNQQAHLYSDLLVHNMGTGLADGVTQGSALGDEFRTAPLWGLGQRIFFLHDGRAADLGTAIAAHASPGSEANTVIGAYNALPSATKQNILNFLQSL